MPFFPFCPLFLNFFGLWVRDTRLRQKSKKFFHIFFYNFAHHDYMPIYHRFWARPTLKFWEKTRCLQKIAETAVAPADLAGTYRRYQKWISGWILPYFDRSTISEGQKIRKFNSIHISFHYQTKWKPRASCKKRIKQQKWHFLAYPSLV